MKTTYEEKLSTNKEFAKSKWIFLKVGIMKKILSGVLVLSVVTLAACGSGGGGAAAVVAAIVNGLTPTTVSDFAGTSGTFGITDGVLNTGKLKFPYDIVSDGTNLYVVDSGNQVIRKVVIATGFISTLAGSIGTTGIADGGVGTGQFNFPRGIAIDSTGTNLYVADGTNHAIRKVVISTGVISTVAGTIGPANSGTADGGIGTGRFNMPYGIAIDSTNTFLYVADYNNNAIRRVVIGTGIISTLAGTIGPVGGTADGVVGTGKFDLPWGIAIDSTNTNLYIADSNNCTIRKVVIGTGVVSTFTGIANSCVNVDGASGTAKFQTPESLIIDSTDSYLYVGDNYTVRKIAVADGTTTTLAGDTANFGATNGAALGGAQFDEPYGLALVGTVLYEADYFNHVIRKIE